MATGDTNTKNKIINLANVEFTENGLYVPNKGVTGFGKVKVTVPPDAMKKPLYITPSATDNISTPTWDEYTGPYIDNYVKPIGYKKENKSVYDFNNVYIGRASIEGVIIDGEQKTIGKVSTYNTVYNVEEDHIIGYSDEKNFAYDLQDTKIGTVRPDNTVVDSEQTVIGRRHASEYLAYNNAENEYIGVRDVKVRKIGSWIDSEISADNIRQGHSILGVSGHVVELHGEERTVNSSTYQQVITPSNGKNGITKVTVNPYTLQNKTVDPEFVAKSYYADSGYNGLNRVTVNPIDVQTIVEEEPQLKPENVKKNVRLFGGQIVGTYDNYVAPVVQPVSISPKTTSQLISPPSGVDGFNRVAVDAVTSSIDSNIKPENIRRNVNILGVEGTFVVEKLQDKTVDPQPYQQVVTFDSSEADGLNSVTVNAVTNAVDENITAGNIRKDVTILGVTGEFDPKPIIQPTVTVTPTTLNQTVTPNPGYDGLGRVDINAVTSAIDPNILAENIKKNIDILGVTGTYDPKPNYQESKTVQPITSGDIEVTADPTYDALLKVIVKAVTASIDPNILPKNIRKNISILGVLGSMEEGGEQKWFDFSGIQNFVELNQDAWSEGGNESIRISTSNTNYELEQLINDTFPAIGNINAIMFTQVYGYDDEEITDDVIKECYINFVGGNLYQEYSKITYIDDQLRYFYPFTNDYNVDGLTIGLDYDDGSERTMKLYVLTNSTKKYAPVPVLVNGDMNSGLLPSDYDGFRYIKDIVVPAHDVYIPKLVEKEDVQWVLRDADTIRTKIIPTDLQPDVIQASAYDRNYGETDEETDIVTNYKLKEFKDLTLQKNSFIAMQSTPGTAGSIIIPGTVEKQSGYYYYFKVKPQVMDGYNTYYPLVSCDGLFRIYLYRYYNYYNYYHLGWQYNWNSATSGNLTYYSYYLYVGGTYYIRVYVNGTTARLDFSSDGVNWTNNINTVSSGYINPTNTNPIYIYASSGPNTQLCTDGIYITDGTNKVYSVLKEIKGKQTSHDIVPLIDDMLLVNRDTSRYSVKYQGDERYQVSSFDSSASLLDMGTNGNIEVQNGFYVNNKTWEICQHFRLTPIIGSNNRHLASWSNLESSTRRSCLWIDTGNCICWRVYRNSGGNTVVDGRLTSTALTVGTDYYIKYGWNGSTYYMYVSTSPTFDSYVTSWTTNGTSITYCDTSKLLIGNWTYNATNGSMRYLYLDDYTYVKVNNEIIWKPITDDLYGNIVNYTDDGSPVVLDAYLASSNLHGKITNADIVGNVQVNKDGIASGFSSSNYLTTPEHFNPGNNPWEVYAKVVTGSSVTSEQDIFGVTTDQNLFRVGLAGTVTDRFQILVANSGKWINTSNHYGTYSVLANTTYWIKAGFDGIDTYYLEYSLDGETYIRDVAYTSSTKIGVVSNIYTTISSGLSSVNVSWTGLVDLSQTYIKINGEIWWQPNIVQTYDYDWIFTKDENWTYTGLTNLGKKGELIVPEHNIYQWNQSKMKWEGLKQLTFNIIDEDEFYTNVIEN